MINSQPINPSAVEACYSQSSLLGILLVCLTFSLFPLTGSAGEAKPEPITKAEVLKSLKENAPAWEAKIRTVSPRLYFSSKEWPQVQKEIENMPPPRAAIAAAFFAEMDRVVAEPLPVYLPPEQMVGKRGDTKTLYSALEELWQREIGDQIFALSVAARLKPDAAYKTKLHDLVMAAVGFQTWGRSKNPPMGDNSDLAAGHVGRGIAVAYDWHQDLFTEAEREQIRKVVAERMSNLLEGLYGNAYWARGYQENHNQVSVAALGFCGIAFYDEIPAAPEWLAASRLNFIKVGDEASADGSSVEGVSYWNYGITFILQYIEATRLIIDSGDLYKLPFLKNAAAYRLMAATPGLTGNLPWGDAVTKDWAYPHHIIYRLAAEYQDSDAAWFADHLPTPKGDALNLLWARNAPPSGPGPKKLDDRLEVNDLATSRTGWESEDYVLSLKGGFTNRNHSHLDAGALALAFGNEWVLIAPGYGKGAGEGAYWQSNGGRWNYFANATESHSTLLVNGKNQRFDHDARATITRFFSSPGWNWTTMDLSRAYSDVQAITRSVLHRRGDYILVFDSVSAAQPVSVEWLAQFRTAPVQENGGSLLENGKNGALRVTMLEPALAFSERAPTSPKVDVKKEAHFTYEISQSGQKIEFVALLQPVPGSKQTPPLKPRVESAAPEINRMEIAGAGWTDHVVQSDKPTELRFPLSEPNNEARLTARVAAIRTAGDKAVSVLALDATSVQFSGIEYHAANPCDLAIEAAPDGGWNVTASRDVRSQIQASDGRKIHFAPTESR